jgi:hypothetical protein
MPLAHDLRWRATHRSAISRASGLRPHVAFLMLRCIAVLACCTAGLLQCWPAALLACCSAGLLHCCNAMLHCWPAGLLHCCNAMLRCWAAALLHSRHAPCSASACLSMQLSMQLSTASNHTSLPAYRLQGHRKRKAADAPRARVVGLRKGDRKAKKRYRVEQLEACAGSVVTREYNKSRSHSS